LIRTLQRLLQLLGDALQVAIELREDFVHARKDRLAGQILERLGREEHAVDGDRALQVLQALAERGEPLGNGRKHALLANEEALLLEALFEAGLAEPLEGLLEPGKRRETLFDLSKLGSGVEQAAPVLLQVAPQVGLAARERLVALDEAVKQTREFLAALGELGNLVLAVDLDSREYVLR